MDPTQVRIRGKRYWPGQKPAPDLRKARGRLRINRNRPATDTNDDPRSAKRQRNDNGSGRPSLLEGLPTEILRHIFILSANVALPTASPFLQQKLTDDDFKCRLFIQLFALSRPNSWVSDLSPRIAVSYPTTKMGYIFVQANH